MLLDEKILNLVFKGFDEDFINSLSDNINVCDINIFNDLGYDSIKLIQLIVDLEEMFKVEIDDEMLWMDNFSTIKQIIETITDVVKKTNGEIYG